MNPAASLLSLLSFCVLFTSSCSLLNSDLDLDTTNITPLTSVELSLKRASINSRDFEQYKLAADVLFFECGTFEGGRRKVIQSDVLQISKDRAVGILKIGAALADEPGMASNTLSKSGHGDSFFDPGSFQISLNSQNKPIKLETSLDSISGPSNKIERQLKIFTEQIRGLTTEPACNNDLFYGFSRLQ